MKKLIASIVALVMSLFVFGAALYAWFSGAELFQNIVFQLNGVDATVTVAIGEDFNKDGYLDATESGDTTFVTATESTIWAIAPTEIVTYQVSAVNNGTQGAVMSIQISGFANELLTYFEFRCGATVDAMIGSVFAAVTSEVSVVNKYDVAVGATAVYYFQLRMKPYEGSVTDAAYTAYQNLQTAAQKSLTLTVTTTAV